MQTTRDCRFTHRRDGAPQAADATGAIQPNAHYPPRTTSMRDTYDTPPANSSANDQHQAGYGRPPKRHPNTPPPATRTYPRPRATPGGATDPNSTANPPAGQKTPNYSSSGGFTAWITA